MATSALIQIRRRQDEAPPAAFIEERIEGARETFLFPYLDGYLYYSPLADVSMLLDEFGASAIRKHFRGTELTASEQAFIDALAARNAFPDPRPADRTGLPAATGWAPTSATFSNTQKCTLRCTYCYAEGGRLDDLDIPWPVAKAALDLIVSNAVKQQVQPSISFLGEGEATANWGGFRQIIEHFTAQCEARAMAPVISLSTNGVFAEQRLDFIARHCTHVTFSLDGLRDVHDANRVLPNGRGSFERIIANMRGLEARGRSYDIRSTVTAGGSTAMAAFVRFVGEQLQCKSVHFEPIFDVAGLTKGDVPIESVDARAFVSGFREARRTAAGHGIEVYYSGASTRHRETFCGASDASTFLITSRGLVTSCNEVLQASDPRAGLFHYGAWSHEAGEFVVDPLAIARLGKLNVHDMPKCQGCLAKYNCAGDCYAKTAAAAPGGDPAAAGYTDRCYITRELLKDNLLISLIAKMAGTDVPARLPRSC